LKQVYVQNSTRTTFSPAASRTEKSPAFTKPDGSEISSAR
jgi:hypothetical protein